MAGISCGNSAAIVLLSKVPYPFNGKHFYQSLHVIWRILQCSIDIHLAASIYVICTVSGVQNNYINIWGMWPWIVCHLISGSSGSGSVTTTAVAEAVAQAAATSIAAAFAKISNGNMAVASAVSEQTVKSQIQMALAMSASTAQLTGKTSKNVIRNFLGVHCSKSYKRYKMSKVQSFWICRFNFRQNNSGKNESIPDLSYRIAKGA